MIFRKGQQNLLFVVMLTVLISVYAQDERKEEMSSIFNDFETNTALQHQSSRLTYGQANLTLTPAAANSKHPGSLRPYSNSSHNSRSTVSLNISNSTKPWQLAWQAKLEPQYPASFILAAKESIIVQGFKSWTLFDDEGFKLNKGVREDGDIVLDPLNNAFYLTDPNGFIAVMDLADGSLSYLLETLFGQGFQRTVLSRQENTLLIHSIELAHMPLVSEPIPKPGFNLFELQNLGETLEIDAYKFLLSSELVKGLSNKAETLLIRFNEHQKHSIVATDGHIYRLDSKLETVSDFTGDFALNALSLDEAGSIYLVVNHEGKNKLWRVNQNAVIEVEAELPDSFQPSSYPPVISYQHQVLLVGTNTVLALDPAKGIKWKWQSDSNIVGVTVTTNEYFLVTTGSQVVALGSDGRAQLLAQLDTELLTPPILTTEGKILAASAQNLYCLAAF